MINTLYNRELIGIALSNVAERSIKNRALILTESDLKCQVYMELSQIEIFGRMAATFDDGITGSALHSETKFFNGHGLLDQAPDLVLTDPSRLSIRTRLDGSLLPTKGFHFDGEAILIELKFLRGRYEPDSRQVLRIEEDILKGKTLEERGNLNFHLFVAVYDRFQSGSEKVNKVFQRYAYQKNLTCLYFSGGPPFL